MLDCDSEPDDDRSSNADEIEVPEELEDDEDNDLYGDESDTEDESDNVADSFIEDEVVYVSGDDNGEANEEESRGDHSSQPTDIRELLKHLVDRVRSCIGNIRSTRVVFDHVQACEKTSNPPITAGLITDLEIRWNTTFIMIDRFVAHRVIMGDVNSRPDTIPNISSTQQSKLGAKRFEFTNDDWCAMQDLRAALRPFFGATNVISAKSYPTLAAAYSGELVV